MILALDIASSTGWAFGLPGTRPITGTISVDGSLGDRMRYLCGHLHNLIADLEPEIIIFEEPWLSAGKGSAKTMRGLICLAGVAEMVAANQKVQIVETTADTWRKHFVGVTTAPRAVKGKATRRAWIKAIVAQRCAALGWSFSNDDESDACGIWDFACSLRSRAHQVHTAPGLFEKTGG
ncbi:MAG: hypothetical protein AAGI03_00670 [Pseudomonadota bacterium]